MTKINLAEAFSFIFAFLIAAMSWGFAINEENFVILVATQGAFIFWVFCTSIFTSKIWKISAYGGSVISILTLVLFSNLLVNHEVYRLMTGYNIQFVFAHIMGILAFLFAAHWATYNLNAVKIFNILLDC